MPFFPRREPHVIICRGFHLSGGEQVKLRLQRTGGTEEEINVTVSVVAGYKDEDDENSVIDELVVWEH